MKRRDKEYYKIPCLAEEFIASKRTPISLIYPFYFDQIQANYEISKQNTNYWVVSPVYLFYTIILIAKSIQNY